MSPSFSAEKLVGGENAVSTVFEGTKTPTAVIVDESLAYDEVIGGHHVKQITNEGAGSDNLVRVENDYSDVSVSAMDGVQYVVGGSKSNNAYADLQTGRSGVTITAGTIGLSAGASADTAVIGGNLIKATVGQGGESARADTRQTQVEIKGGTFVRADIIGGSKANAYGTDGRTLDLSLIDLDTRVLVSGGDFSQAGSIIGGSVADGAGTQASVVSSAVVLTGGIFKAESRQSVYGGSVALNGGTASTQTSSLTVVGGEDFGLKTSGGELVEQGKIYLTLYAGGLNAATTKLSTLTIRDADLGYMSNSTTTKTVQLYSGSHYEVGGTYAEGDAVLNVTNSTVRGDIRGTSWVGPSSGFAEGFKVTAASSTVNVADVVMNGYTQGVSTWNGRIFGAGILQYTGNSEFTVDSTTVTVSNVTGVDLEQGTGEISHDPGVRIFGGGQLYNNNHADAGNNTLSVKKTSVTLSGEKSEVLDVIGGSIISGTNAHDSNTIILGTSEVHVSDAYVAGRIVGGNDVNWFGTGTVSGDTTVTVDGAARVGAVIGANSTTFWDAYMFGAGVRKADMQGDTRISLAGSSTVSLALGAGYAESYHGGGNPFVGDGTTGGRTQADLNSATVSTMTGNSSVSVSESAQVDVLAGAGYAWSDVNYYIDGQYKQTQHADATLTGSASSTLAGGRIGQWILGGLAEGYGLADVRGEARGTMTGGTAEIVIVGGLGSEVGVYDLQYDSSTGKSSLKDDTKTDVGSAAITGSAVLTASGGKLGTVILGGAVSDIDGVVAAPADEHADGVKVAGTAALVIAGEVDLSETIVTRGSADSTRLQFGTDGSAWIGSFAAFSGIDELRVSAGSQLALESLTSEQMGQSGIELAGEGVLSLQRLDHADKTVRLTAGTLAADRLAMSADGRLEVAGGTLLTSSSSIFTTGLAEDGMNASAGELTDQVKNHVVFGGGVLSLTDKTYNIHYASSAASLVGSETQVVFGGTLVDNDTTDVTEKTLTVSDYVESAGAIASNVIFAGAQLDASQETSGSHLTIGKAVAELDDQIVIGQDVGVGSVKLDADARFVTVNDNRILTLVGNGSNLLDGAQNPVTIEVGTGEKDTGTLRLGTTGAQHSGGIINADVTVNAGSELKVQAGAFAGTGAFANAGDIQIDKGASLSMAQLKNTGRITIEGSARVDALKASESAAGGLVVVGSQDCAGEFHLGGDSLGGNTIFLDPAWRTDGTNVIEEASKLISTVTDFDGGVIVGRNSFAVIGTDSAESLLNHFNRSNLSWGPVGGVTAAAYLAGPIDVTQGSFVIDGSLTQAPATIGAGTVAFGADSLLVAEVSSLQSGKALIAGVQSATVDESAHLILAGVTADRRYQIIENPSQFWSQANITAANGMFGGAQLDADGSVSFSLKDAGSVYGSLLQGREIADAGMRSDATSQTFGYVDKLLTQTDGNLAAAARRFDAAMNPGGALTVFTNAMDRAAELRAAVREESGAASGSRLWARVSGGKTKFDGLATAAQSIHADIETYGLMLGGEFAVGEGLLGAAFAAGTGNTQNNAVHGKDDFDYYAVSLYGRTSAAGFDLLGDMSVTWLKSSLSIGGGADVDADTTTTVWSIGGQIERTFALGWADVTPFIGLDIYHIDGEAYGNGHGARIQKSDATAVEIPLGARLSAAIETAGDMKVTPQITLAVVPSVADTDFDGTVVFAGAASDYNFTFADDVKLRSRLGVTAVKNDWRFALNAGYDWGSEQRQAFSGMLTVKYGF